MLQTMRHLAQSWLFKGLMILLVISFGIWGIGDMFHGNPLQRTVAKAGKLDITVQMLNRAFDQSLQQARQVLGPDLSASEARSLGLYDQALETLINRAEVEQGIDRLGIRVSDKDILGKIMAQPQFQDKDGKFDKQLFRSMVNQSNMSERGFLDIARKEMAQQQLYESLQSSPKTPATIAERVYFARGQKHVFDVVTVRNGGIAETAAPDDKTLQDYYANNSAAFMAPEYRAITLVSLSADDAAKDIAVSEDELKKQYDAKSAELARPERRDVLQVVLQDEARAKELAAAAKKSGNLAAAAAKSAGNNPVPLNGMEEKTTPPVLAQPIFSMPEGQISDPVKSDLGWHVLQVEKIEPAGMPSFDSVKDQLREAARQEQAIENVTNMIDRLDDELAAGHSLEDIADGMKLRLVRIPALDAEGKTPDGTPPAELPGRPASVKTAFGQASGETSPILDDRNGHYTVVRTDNVTPGAAPPFAQIKDKVAAAWKSAESARRAASAAENIAKAMREGKPAAAFAADPGVDVRLSKPVSMIGDRDPDISENIATSILKLKKGEVTVIPQGDRQLVVRLAQRVDAAPVSPDNGAYGRVASELNTRMPNEIVEQYVKYLRVIFPVDIDRGLLESLRQQGS
ncbi:MAG: SurA N-terminal domain-containing protein [Bdellovibrionales bacterium]